MTKSQQENEHAPLKRPAAEIAARLRRRGDNALDLEAAEMLDRLQIYVEQSTRIIFGHSFYATERIGK